MNENHIKVMPEVPDFAPLVHLAQSATVVIQTLGGEWHTARLVVFLDPNFDSRWELDALDEFHLSRDEVALWFYPSASFANACQQR